MGCVIKRQQFPQTLENINANNRSKHSRESNVILFYLKLVKLNFKATKVSAIYENEI